MLRSHPFLAGAGLVLSLAVVLSCAEVQPPKPKVVLPVMQYPNSGRADGITVAVVPFDPKRDVYAETGDLNVRVPDFNWIKAGVLPVRLIFQNEGSRAVHLEPAQITGTDVRGVIYRPYNAGEAGDAVVASEAFNSYTKGALGGGALGAALGAATGAAVGAIAGGGGWAGRGAAIGGGVGGARGLFLGSARNRTQMERRVRQVLRNNELKPHVLGPGMNFDGLVYFPAVSLRSVKVLLPGRGYEDQLTIEVPVTMPAAG